MAFGAGLTGLMSIGSAGLQIMGGMSAAQGQSAAYQYQQERAQRMQRNALIQADQTDAHLRKELASTLGNISAIRAAAYTDSTSPTQLAVEDEEMKVSGRERQIRVGNLRSQAESYAADAEYFGYAASQAMSTGWMNAFSTGIKTLAGMGGTA